jgi:hypothetical protein
MVDHARNHLPKCEDCLLLLHPDKGEAAVVSVKVPATRKYDVDAVFARANDLNAGNGVRVVVCVNGDFGAPLLDELISSDHKVYPTRLFSGTGTKRFQKTVALQSGDLLHFAVFVGTNPSDPDKIDRDFDLTALRATISAGGTSIVLPRDAPGVTVQANTSRPSLEPSQEESKYPDLAGIWSATYPGGPLRVRITQNDKNVVATLIDGNAYVPSGAVTFSGSYDSMSFSALQTCAQVGYQNPFKVPVRISVRDKDRFVETNLPGGPPCGDGTPVVWTRIQ